MTHRSALFFGSLALVAASLSGCLSLEKSYPQKRFYVLAASRPGAPSPFRIDATLRVRSFRISPSYSGSEFVYRTGDVTSESDFYNEFFNPPSRLVTEQVHRWFAASGLFKAVVDSSSPIEAGYVLEGAIGAIYGEHIHSESPRAVLELQFFLLKETEAEVGIVLQGNFSKNVDLADDSPETLARGWNQALQEILTAFEEKLRSSLDATRAMP